MLPASPRTAGKERSATIASLMCKCCGLHLSSEKSCGLHNILSVYTVDSIYIK